MAATNDFYQQTLKKLRHKWAITAVIGFVYLIATFTWIKSWWLMPYLIRWLFMACVTMSYLLWILWRGLKDNHRSGDNELLSTFGLGNMLSLTRGFILVFFCGFLFSPWPDVGWMAWLPGLLYTLAVLPDYLDGAAARWTNHVTKLGETLDISIDSLAVFSVTLLSIQYGQVPWWYLPVGLARYIFLIGVKMRSVLGLPVYELPFSVRRRGYAGLTMGLFFVILYPVFTPPGTYVVATVFAIYLLGGFLWDWLLTIGRLPPNPGEAYIGLEKIIVRLVPFALRILLLIWVLEVFLPRLTFNSGEALFWLEATTLLCMILGVAGRIAAIAALVILGIHQASEPLKADQLTLIVLYTNLLFLGTGVYSIWPVENRMIYTRLGEQT